MLLAFRPYRQSSSTFLSAIGAQFALAFSMLVSLCIRVFDDIATRWSHREAQQVMKFDGPSEMVGVTILFAFFVLLVLAIITTREASEEATKSGIVKRITNNFSHSERQFESTGAKLPSESSVTSSVTV
jgi:H+/Cl- antiporter ClcA